MRFLPLQDLLSPSNSKPSLQEHVAEVRLVKSQLWWQLSLVQAESYKLGFHFAGILWPYSKSNLELESNLSEIYQLTASLFVVLRQL